MYLPINIFSGHYIIPHYTTQHIDHSMYIHIIKLIYLAYRKKMFLSVSRLSVRVPVSRDSTRYIFRFGFRSSLIKKKKFFGSVLVFGPAKISVFGSGPCEISIRKLSIYFDRSKRFIIKETIYYFQVY
jgi:hypothetical protein